ncbi:MAG: ATP-binding cassette domain-containing protein, partial [Bacteroidota bacterium]
DTDELNHHELRRGIGYVIQNIGLFPHYTISQNIGVVPGILGWEKDQIDLRVDELLSLVGLDNNLKIRKPNELSGGQQQRVGIARALAADPQLVLLDEPFGALDPITRKEIQDEFQTLESVLDKTMIMVTHDVKEACILGDRICLMDNGEIQQIGTPKELIFQPTNNFVESFIGNNAFELELVVVKVESLLPYLAKINSIEDRVVIQKNASLQSAIESCSEHNNGVIEHENAYYEFSADEILKLYFRNRTQIISSIL